MGLSIAYQLSLPAATNRASVIALLTRLRERALTLPVNLVTDMLACDAGDALGSPGGSGVPLEFWFRSWAALTLDPEGGSELPDANGFIVSPGDECEPAAFGVARTPPYDRHWCHQYGPLGWWWHSVTKTQYASVVSAEHFVRCHSVVVTLLDAARELGFEVQVFDEGGYWESRDADRLLAHVDRMNRLVAGLAGAVHDRLGRDHSVEAPIFAHPDFERLETRPVSRPAPPS